MNQSSPSKTCKNLALILAIFVCSIAVSHPLLSQDGPGVYQAPSEEPTPSETLLLEYINRCRANPAEDGRLILESARIPRSVDLEMFEREMLAPDPVPPLVFDLALTKAARWHSAYQIQHGQSHDETPGLAGFTGASPGDRIQKAGFRGRGFAENVFLNSPNPWSCHAGFIVDWGTGPGGMQPGRGHRTNILSPKWRLAGIGAVPHGNSKLAVTQEFSNLRQRMAGGVVYDDANGNRFYDIGEGVGDVGFSAQETAVKSWASGAYALPIPEGEHKMEIQIGESTYIGLLPDGSENFKFDVVLADVKHYASLTKMVNSLSKIPDDERNQDRRFAALTNLYLASRNSLIEATVYDEVLELTAGVKEKLDAAKEETRQALSGSDMDLAKTTTTDYAKAYRRTEAKHWFNDAKNCLGIVKTYQRLKEQREETGEPLSDVVVEKAIRSQQKAFQRLSVPEWQTFGLKIAEQIQQLAE